MLLNTIMNTESLSLSLSLFLEDFVWIFFFFREIFNRPLVQGINS